MSGDYEEELASALLRMTDSSGGYRGFRFNGLDCWDHPRWRFYIYRDGDSWRIGLGMGAYSGACYATHEEAIDAAYVILGAGDE